jgi:glycosyltransferase involved in cell wall biosynthesis
MNEHAEHKAISIFIPAYNAGNTLVNVIKRIPQNVMNITGHIYIINDGSIDNTSAVCKKLQKTNQNIQHVPFEKNQGYGTAVKKGLDLCKNDGCSLAVCLHSDGQYPPEYIQPIVENMTQIQADIIQGSRMAYGKVLKKGMPFYKYIAGKALTFIENIVFNNKMTDRHSGYLFYSKKAMETLQYHKLSSSFDFDMEILASAYAANLKVSEYPIPTKYGDEASYLNPITYGLRVLRVLFRYKTGRYSII